MDWPVIEPRPPYCWPVTVRAMLQPKSGTANKISADGSCSSNILKEPKSLTPLHKLNLTCDQWDHTVPTYFCKIHLTTQFTWFTDVVCIYSFAFSHMQQLLLIFWRLDSAPNITPSSGLNARILPNSKAATNVYTETLNAKRWRSPLLHQLHYKCIRVSTKLKYTYNRIKRI